MNCASGTAYDPAAHCWGCPIRQQWALTAYQQPSPGLQDRLAFTLTATGSYEQAAAVAAKWGCPTDDATLHALAQRLGARAEAHTQQRLVSVPTETTPPRAPSALTVLQMDGWQVRQRGPGWGRKTTNQPRVEWHELKTVVAYRHEQAGHSANGRGLLAQKRVVSWQGQPLELGRRLHWEALRHGLARSRDTLVVADGAPWIWKVAADRWKAATELLDFYHASQHLWELGRALSRGDEAQAAAWVEPRRHQLRHGQQCALLRELAALRPPRTTDEPRCLGPTGLADWQRGSRVSLSATPMSVQAVGPVLDGDRTAPLGRTTRSPSQRPLG